jgi:hypothetical protein
VARSSSRSASSWIFALSGRPAKPHQYHWPAAAAAKLGVCPRGWVAAWGHPKDTDRDGLPIAPSSSSTPTSVIVNGQTHFGTTHTRPHPTHLLLARSPISFTSQNAVSKEKKEKRSAATQDRATLALTSAQKKVTQSECFSLVFLALWGGQRVGSIARVSPMSYHCH